MNNKDALLWHSLNQRERVMTSGKSILLFDTATALLIGGDIMLHPLSDDLVFIKSIIKTYIWDFQSNTPVKTIDYSLLSQDLDIVLDSENNSKTLLQKLIQEPLQRKPMPITVDYITVKPSSNLFGNTNQWIIGNKDDSTLSNVINYNSPPGTIGSYDKHSFDDIIRLNDKFIGALIKGSIVIYDVSQSYNNQCNTVVVLHKRKNCYICLFDLINGRIKEPMTIKHQIYPHSNSNNDTLAYDLKNHCVLLVSGIPKMFQLFNLELYHSIKHLTDKDEVIRIDKIGNKDQYLFVMKAYDFYVYDIKKREYIQKISSLMTTMYCISKNYLIYYSKLVCYSVKISIKENKEDNSLSKTIY